MSFPFWAPLVRPWWRHRRLELSSGYAGGALIEHGRPLLVRVLGTDPDDDQQRVYAADGVVTNVIAAAANLPAIRFQAPSVLGTGIVELVALYAWSTAATNVVDPAAGYTCSTDPTWVGLNLASLSKSPGVWGAPSKATAAVLEVGLSNALPTSEQTVMGGQTQQMNLLPASVWLDPGQVFACIMSRGFNAFVRNFFFSLWWRERYQ